MTKKEMAAAIIENSPMKNWRECLKEAERRKLERQPKAELEKFYKIKCEERATK